MFLKYFSSRTGIFFLVCIASLLITFASIHSAQNAVNHANIHIEQDMLIVKTVLQDEVDKFIYGLQGARGVFIANNLKFDHKVFSQYASSRNYFNNFNGSLGFGFIRYVKEKDFESYKNQQRKIRDYFQVHPEIKTQEHMVIELIEPIDRNRPALGLDVAFEENRREAAYLAARTGEGALTKTISLVQQNQKHVGFLFFLPIYRTTSVPESEEERMKNLIGWAYTPIVLDNLIDKAKVLIPSDLNITLEIDSFTQPIKMGELPGKDSVILKQKTASINVSNQIWKIVGKPATNELFQSLLLTLCICISTVVLLIIGGTRIYKSLLYRDKSLVEQSNLMKSIVNNAGHMVITTNPAGLITSFNKRAESSLGYKASDLIGKETPILFHDHDEVQSKLILLEKQLNKKLPSPFDVFVHKARKGIIDTNEWLYVAKDGKRIPVRLSVTAILDEEKNIIGYLGIAEDLTEYNKMILTIEQQRANMVETAKLSQLGEMATSIAHEINTPLTVILGKTYQLSELVQHSNFDKKNADDQINKIAKMAEQIAKIVKGLKTVSRNSAEDPYEKICVKTTVESTLDLCKEKIDKFGIRLDIDILDSITVFGHASELSQVILNLMNNAIDAVSEKSDKWIQIKMSMKDEKGFIYITDSGSGIPTHIVEKMMNPFFTTKEVGKGTGLGLSISKKIIEGHGGKLYYDSTCKNTRFVIELPVAKNEDKKSA